MLPRCRQQGVTTCGLSSLASFLKILSSKHVCCVFRDIRDKNAVNQGFWSKTAVFSLPATKVDCLLIFWLPHLYNLLQPGIRKQHKCTSILEYLYLAINKAKFALLRGFRTEDQGVRTEDWGLRTEDSLIATEDQRLQSPFFWPDVWVKSESNRICLSQNNTKKCVFATYPILRQKCVFLLNLTVLINSFGPH